MPRRAMAASRAGSREGEPKKIGQFNAAVMPKKDS